MLVLGIETTCDETACAIVKDGVEIIAESVASQAELHSRYGGVVPELSCRLHVETLIPLIDATLRKGNVELNAIDLIAISHAPGLIGALWIGLNAAKALSLALKKPLIGVNHVEAHLYAALMSNAQPPNYPCLGVVASGGHTALWRMEQLGVYTLLGQTIDDAIGEAFDKAAKMLNLPYPGGPHIEALAKGGNPKAFRLRAGQVKPNPFNFSFSGLKTALLYTLHPPKGEEPTWDEQGRRDLAASFQEAAIGDLVDKACLAAERYHLTDIVLGGGVTNNQRLRERFALRAPHIRCLWPTLALSLDNAVMIAGLGFWRFIQHGKIGDPLSLQAITRLPLGGTMD